MSLELSCLSGKATRQLIAPDYSVARHLLDGHVLTFDGGDGADTLIADFSNGSPFEGSIDFAGGGSDRDVLEIRGSASSDTIDAYEDYVSFGTGSSGTQVSYFGVEGLEINAGGGDDEIRIAPNGSPDSTDYALRGNDGVDTLMIDGAGTASGSSNGAETIVVNGQRITVRGIEEPVKVENFDTFTLFTPQSRGRDHGEQSRRGPDANQRQQLWDTEWTTGEPRDQGIRHRFRSRIHTQHGGTR